MTMRDHTPDFRMHELSQENKALIGSTVKQLLEKLAVDGRLCSEALLEFWVEVAGAQRPRGTYRNGCLMPDSFIYIRDYFRASESGTLLAGESYVKDGTHDLESAWDDMLDELFYQIEIFTSPVSTGKGITLELWAGCRQRPEGDWVYAVDTKVELE
uniref:Uncharacterized protein n=1 Tax=Chlorobium chlorochromatii (strain CaD3) TaxID=340177 RepID=Q3ATL7_CHLCH